MTVMWAIHRLSGIATPANAAYSISELSHQLRSSGAKVLFTCTPLLKVALDAAEQAGIPRRHVYLLQVPFHEMPDEFKSVNQLIAEGNSLPPLPKSVWGKGQGARQVALLSYSSGTSGPPVSTRNGTISDADMTDSHVPQKAVMISHLNVINNILQIEAYERPQRGEAHQAKLGMMPQSHIYGLIVICHATIYVGDCVVTLPKYKFDWMLAATERFRIETMFLVSCVPGTLW
jgi:acyl-CoA synthetase (AMP-forming)/AMP-acid ligase II